MVALASSWPNRARFNPQRQASAQNSGQALKLAWSCCRSSSFKVRNGRLYNPSIRFLGRLAAHIFSNSLANMLAELFHAALSWLACMPFIS